MERRCTITPLQTEARGAATIPAEQIVRVIAPIVSEKLLQGSISPRSQETLNRLCSSARFSGTVDDQAFVQGMEKSGLTVDCSTCPYHS